MRLQLILFSILTTTSFAQGVFENEDKIGATAGGEFYADDDGTTVVTLAADGRARVTDSLEVVPHITFDAISSASVDVISAATPSFTGARLEGGAALHVRALESDWMLKAVGSVEEDWASGSGQASWTRLFAQKNTALSAAFGFTYNSISDARDGISFSESMNASTWEFGIGQLLTPRLRVQIAYTGQYMSGYQGSPYRAVQVGTRFELEKHPETRFRNSITLSFSAYLGKKLGLQTAVRGYRDDWGMNSYVLQTALWKDFSPSLTGSLRVRGYQQSQADFYRDDYRPFPNAEFWSFDKEMASMWNIGGGPSFIWRYTPKWKFTFSAEAIRYEFRNFSELPVRNAFVGTITSTYSR